VTQAFGEVHKNLTFLYEQQQAFDGLGSESRLDLHQLCFPYKLHKPGNPPNFKREREKKKKKGKKPKNLCNKKHLGITEYTSKIIM
jgi:hypothetical protein